MTLIDLKSLIDAHAYAVDPHLVAEALLRRGDLGQLTPGGAHSPSAATRPAPRGS